MNTKRILSFFIASLIMLNPAYGQAFSDYSLDDLTTTAVYGTGERQTDAQNSLGIRYENGTGGAQKNPARAFYWYQKSASNGNVYGIYNLGRCYLLGLGVPANDEKGVFWMEKAARRYLPAACSLVGKWYFSGLHVECDFKKAVKYLKDASNQGDAEAMVDYAYCIAYGHTEKRDSTKVLYWLNRAIAQKNVYAYAMLGTLYYDGVCLHKDLYNSELYFKKAADNNSAYAQYRLGFAYETGTFWFINIPEAINYYSKAVEGGNMSAMTRLARLLSDENSEYKDYKKAITLYTKLYNLKKSKETADELIKLYRRTKDYKGLANLYTQMSEDGDCQALNELGYLYAKGQGVDKDFKAALSCINRAISLAPDILDYRDSKGEILLMMGEEKKAVKEWKFINKTNPYYYKDYIRNHMGYEPPFYKYMKAKKL